MIQTERVRHMVHLQAFHDHEGRDCFPVVKYFCADYVWIHILRAFVSATVTYGLLLAIWGVCHMEQLMADIHTMDLRRFATDVILRYILFVVIYLVCVAAYARIKYTRAKKEMKQYKRHLKRLDASFRRDGGTSS